MLASQLIVVLCSCTPITLAADLFCLFRPFFCAASFTLYYSPEFNREMLLRSVLVGPRFDLWQINNKAVLIGLTSSPIPDRNPGLALS